MILGQISSTDIQTGQFLYTRNQKFNTIIHSTLVKKMNKTKVKHAFGSLHTVSV